jgi:predicted TPR repeat methyltransferase
LVFATFSHNNSELVRIEMLIRDNQLSDAASALTELGAREPQDPRVYSLGAMLGLAANNPAAALKSADVALGIAPGWPRALVQRARALQELGRLQEALNACNEAVDGDVKQYAAIDMAVQIGRRIGNTEIPEGLLRRAMASDPENVSVWLGLGRFLSRYKQDEAIVWLEKVLASQPENIDALTTLSSLHVAAGRVSAAQALTARALALEPDNEAVRFQAARARGDGEQQIPSAMVRNLFDDYAERFDKHLIAGLGYRLPKIVAEKIRTKYPTPTLNVLDLGCGTGLLGVALGKINGYLVGVDLSEKMIAQAVKHNVYSRFHVADVVEALTATDASEYEIVVGTDLLIYISNIEKFVTESQRVLKQGGTLYFSCELATADEAKVVLRTSQRYAHRIDWVSEVCERAGFTSVEIDELVVRTEQGNPIAGFLVTATKASA